MWTCRRWSSALSTAGGSIKGHRTRAAGTRSSSFSTDRPRTPTPTATIGYAQTGLPPSTAGRPALASKPCAQPGSTPVASTNSGGSVSSCSCNCGRTCPTFRWANIGSPPPTGKICSMCSPAASRSFGVFAELREITQGQGGSLHAQTRPAQSRRCKHCGYRRAADRAGAEDEQAGLCAHRKSRCSRPGCRRPRSMRNHAYLVFDTLYGIDTNWMAQPQMVEEHQVEEDGLTWTLRLRDGLRFHDKEPVLARDVVASIRRFAQRISFADALMAATEELSGHPTIAPCGSV